MTTQSILSCPNPLNFDLLLLNTPHKHLSYIRLYELKPWVVYQTKFNIFIVGSLLLHIWKDATELNMILC